MINSSAEDDDPEWRSLDYSVDVGQPPASLCEFVRQYDWTLYANFCSAQSELESVKKYHCFTI